MDKNPTIWRLHTLTKGYKDDNEKQVIQHIGEYCKEKNIAAIGWSVGKEGISSFEEYMEHSEKKGYKNSPIKLFYELSTSVGDLIWIRNDGKYYIGRVNENSYWNYNNKEHAFRKDAQNQITNIEWFLVNNESGIPGSIITSFIPSRTLQRMKKYGIREHSMYIYNKLYQKKYNKFIYDIDDILNEKAAANPIKLFYNLLSPHECEDLLYFWLYNKYGYICVPSSNKISTQKYEYVLIDPSNGRKILAQVKKGEINLNSDDYKDFIEEFWLFSTEGIIKESKIINSENKIKIANPEDLYYFIKDNRKMISDNILSWYDMVNEYI